MISRINKFLFIFLVVGLALYVVILNQSPLTVYIAPNSSLSGSSGVLLIATFGLGILVAGLVGVFFGFKSYLRERKLHSLAAQRKAFYDGMLRARGFAACGEWNKARAQWEQLIRKDPTDIIARSELSRSLQAEGDYVEALRVLDAARATDPKNLEVLFRAAELNVSLGNKTAAVDNLALILQNHPSKRAAAFARDLSEDLGRVEDALEYQGQLLSLGINEEEHTAVSARLDFKRVLKNSEGNRETLRTDLRTFLRKHPTFVPALHRMALLEAELGNTEEAAQYYAKAAKSGHSSSYWNEMAKLWIAKGDPERALAAARVATKETTGEARLIAQLELIRIQLSLNQFDGARQSLDQFQTLATASERAVPPELSQQYLVLRGLYCSQTGTPSEAAEILRKLSQNDLDIISSVYVPGASTNGDAPAARLSTP